jgi:hypothetical protein
VQYEAPWNAVSERLQQTFISKCQVAERGLDEKDLSVIRNMLGVDTKAADDSSAAVVTLENFAKFWPWFHSLLNIIRSVCRTAHLPPCFVSAVVLAPTLSFVRTICSDPSVLANETTDATNPRFTHTR